jgi:hypothetical protein
MCKQTKSIQCKDLGKNQKGEDVKLLGNSRKALYTVTDFHKDYNYMEGK